MWYYYFGGALILLAILIIPSYIMTVKISKVKKENYQKRIYVETNNGCLQMDWYDRAEKESFFVHSVHGYQLYGEFFRNGTETKKTVVIMHGFGANLIVSLKYAKMFLELGFNAVVFDNANSGRSGGKYSTMGKNEKDDLAVIVEKARALTGEGAIIGLHGESLGGATCILYLENDENIAFLVEDCAYSDLFDELSTNAKRKFHMPKFPFMYIGTVICKLRFGYDIFELSPKKVMRKNGGYEKTPIMFIHGTEDWTTPCRMVDELYAEKKGVKKLFKVKYAIHARSFLYDKERYKKEVKSFLESIGII